MRIAVVGVGGAGSAALRFLAKEGHHVVGFERFRVGHDRGSSHGESRIIRHTYPDRLYTEMMGDTYPLWAELKEEAGEELFVRCGGLVFGRRGNAFLSATERALNGVGLPYERLDAASVRQRYSALRLADDEEALYQPESGFLRASACVRANVRLALRHGAELREETTVARVRRTGAGADVELAGGGKETFDRVLVTAGPWMGQLFADLRLPLTVTRQHVAYLAVENAQRGFFSRERLPVWIDADTLHYGFPEDGRIPGVKIARHYPGVIVDPDRPDDHAVDEVANVVRHAAQRFRHLTGATTCTGRCLYTNTPDEDFILDCPPALPNVLLVSGCSGHGFKFTVLLGKIAALWATGGRYGRDLSRFALSRFT